MELASLRSELDTLSELSGQLVSVSGQHETGPLDQLISDLSTEWQLTSDQCQHRLQLVDSAIQQAAAFNEQLTVCTQYWSVVAYQSLSPFGCFVGLCEDTVIVPELLSF